MWCLFFFRGRCVILMRRIPKLFLTFEVLYLFRNLWGHRWTQGPASIFWSKKSSDSKVPPLLLCLDQLSYKALKHLILLSLNILTIQVVLPLITSSLLSLLASWFISYLARSLIASSLNLDSSRYLSKGRPYSLNSPRYREAFSAAESTKVYLLYATLKDSLNCWVKVFFLLFTMIDLIESLSSFEEECIT